MDLILKTMALVKISKRDMFNREFMPEFVAGRALTLPTTISHSVSFNISGYFFVFKIRIFKVKPLNFGFERLNFACFFDFWYLENANIRFNWLKAEGQEGISIVSYTDTFPRLLSISSKKNGTNNSSTSFYWLIFYPITNTSPTDFGQIHFPIPSSLCFDYHTLLSLFLFGFVFKFFAFFLCPLRSF